MSNEELAVLVQRGKLDRLPELWDQVKPLVTKLALKRYRVIDGLGGVTPEDLVQAGFLGVLAAVDSFDPESGYKFTTYLDRNLKTEFSKAACMLSRKQFCDPLHRCDSLDRPVDENEDTSATLADFQGDPDAERSFENTETREWARTARVALDRAMDRLSADQRKTIVGLYFDGKTASDLAKEFGVSRSAICAREQAALRTMRRNESANRLSAYLYE